MADNKIEILWESGTHRAVKIDLPGENELALTVDRMNFTISIPYFEFMKVESIVKIIVQLYKDDPDNIIIKEFLSFLRQSENKEELENFKNMFRLLRT